MSDLPARPPQDHPPTMPPGPDLRAAADPASPPKQKTMKKFEPGWETAKLNNHGMTLFANSGKYEYKVPYSVPTMGYCATVIHPACTCCDACCAPCSLCFPCLSSPPGPRFVDMVDQETGDQIRVQRMKAGTSLCPCIRRTHLVAFHNGQKVGRVSSGPGSFARCRTCLGDASSGNVTIFTLKDQNLNLVGKGERPGKGCCCFCAPQCPLKCISYSNLRLFTCLSCMCYMNPTISSTSCCCGGLPFSPICCECCVKGDQEICKCSEAPCLCLINPFACCQLIMCCCCYPGCTTEDAKMKNSIRHETAHIQSQTGESIGKVQMQWRGGVPSMWKHDTGTPWSGVSEAAKGGVNGILSAALMFAKAFDLGTTPLLGDVFFPDRGPDFDGVVRSYSNRDVDKLVECLDENLNVKEDCVLGINPNFGRNVKGYTLQEVSWDGSFMHCCGFKCGGSGESMPWPQRLTTKQEFVDMYNLSKKHNRQMAYKFHFYIKDLTHLSKGDGDRGIADIVKGSDYKDYYKGAGLRVDYCTCNWITCYRFPCQFNATPVTICKCPYYAKVKSSAAVAPAWDEEQVKMAVPPQVIMEG